MRKDMHKVIVEEPRGGGGRDKKDRQANLPPELLPKREGMRRPYTHRKWFGEHLGPLKRWLRSNCGRPWNEVYSEAASVIKPTDPVRLHIKFHMMQMVERNTFAQDGKIFWYGSSGPVNIADRGGHPIWPTFYVHPESGLLMELPWRRRKDRREAGADDDRRLGDCRILKKLDGLWFECQLAPFPDRFEKGESPLRYDMIRRQLIGPSKGSYVDGKLAFCVKKTQLSKKELKRYGLFNDRTRLPKTAGFNRISRFTELLLSPVGRAAQAAVRKTAEVGAIPTRDSLMMNCE